MPQPPRKRKRTPSGTLTQIAEFRDLPPIPDQPALPPHEEPASAENPAEPQKPKRKRIADSVHAEARGRRKAKKIFVDNAAILAQAIVGVVVNPDSKPTDVLAAARIALEFGIGKAPTQEAPPPSGRPTLKFGSFPTLAALKKSHGKDPE